MRLRATAALSAIVLLAAGCGNTSTTGTSNTPTAKSASTGSSTLLGAGSTFDYPFFSKAFAAYSGSHKVTVNYQPIGSGAGIEQFTKQTVDFGASDVPMSSSELSAAQSAVGDVVQVPVALGGVAMAYTLPGIKSGLKLTGPVIAKIYLGQIKTWNDPAITALNPGMKLPSTTITPVHRSDSSGTSYIFSNYLSDVSPAWSSKVGTGKLPNWPVGIGGKGNPGVAQSVASTPGALGYVELAYVLQNHMTDAVVQNKAGHYVAPTQSSVAAAAAQFPNVSAQNFSIDNAPGTTSYPIAGYSWALLAKSPKSAAKGKELVQLFRWLDTTGQSYAGSLDYVPLPSGVRSTARHDLSSIHT